MRIARCAMCGRDTINFYKHTVKRVLVNVCRECYEQDIRVSSRHVNREDCKILSFDNRRLPKKFRQQAES